MKTTIDIPDELYRQVKAQSALRGQAVREVAVNLFQGWVSQTGEPVSDISAVPESPHIPAWFGGARKYARRVRRHDLSSIRRSIAQGRTGEDGEPADKGRPQ